jgi:hypothetical protein
MPPRPGSARPGGRPPSAAASGDGGVVVGASAPGSPAPRVEFKGGGGARSASAAPAVVEAKYYGDGTWNKAILGESLGSERQQVMFVGYEADGWQDTAAKDIRYPAVKLGGAKAKGPAAAADGEQGTPTKSQDKKKEGKAGKGGRTGKKWEVCARSVPWNIGLTHAAG